MATLKIIIVSFVAISILIIFAPNELSKSRTIDECLGFKIKRVCFGIANDINTSTFQRKINFWKNPNKFCGTVGMSVPTAATECCKGLSGMVDGCMENDCNCQQPLFAPGGLVICSHCGNGLCDKNNNENHCNCPEDCKL